jgi:hypothetical protein
MFKSKWLSTKLVLALVLFGVIAIPAPSASAASSTQTLALKVLLIGGPPTGDTPDPTTVAWADALTSEGVPYTEVDGVGSYGSETVTLPTLSSSDTSGNFNAVVLADTDAAFAAGQLDDLFTYEADFGIRQIDGNAYPDTTRGETIVSDPVTTLDGTSGTITSAGLAAMPALIGIIPFDTGTYGDEATAGAGFTPWITNSTGVLAGVYQHPDTDAQAGVSELLINFDYNNTSLQWLLMAPELINWVTQDTHLGMYRNYFGQDIDDNFIADNQWDNADQCTPAATQPQDYTCSAAVLDDPASWPADAQMSAADVAYVVNWEQQTGITLNLAFNGVGACSADTVADESDANCTGSVTDGTTTFTDPGFATDASDPNDQGLVNALLADKADFNWINHTWSHAFLGCTDFAPQVLTSVTPSTTGGALPAGSYNYVITAATAYGESEPSTPLVTPVTTTGTTGSVTLVWPDATNGSGVGGEGPTLAQEEANHTGGTGFWGYNIYRTASGGSTYGLIGQVPEDPETSTYTFTDTGATTPGAAPGSDDTYPTATNPGIDCANTSTSWDPASDGGGTNDGSIEDEIGLNQAFAAANDLPNFTASTVVTGEHSGIESPNMPTALQATGVTTFATDASRQPTQYSENVGVTPVAWSAPRYPSNIYYNAANWPTEINEYNTLYVAQGTNLGDPTYTSEVGHCDDTSATTCSTTPATEATILASESRIMLSHVLNNDPRVGYAHQTNLIGDGSGDPGSSTQMGYTILALINDMLSQYQSWTSMPLVQVTDTTEGEVLGEQDNWATALGTGNVGATEENGVISVTNSTGASVIVPITAPTGTTTSGTTFGQSYGGSQSAWTSVPTSGVTLDAPTALPAAALSAVAISSTDVFVVGRSPQSALWYQQSSGGGTTWTGWEGLTTTDAASQPAAVVSGSNLYVFFRATDNELHYFVRTGSTWSAELNLGGQIAGNPSAAVDGNGRVIVAALNSAGNVFDISLPSGGSWSSWTSLAGILTGNVSLSTLSGNVYLLGLNAAGLGWTMEWTAGSTNTWGSWTSLGGVFATGTTLAGAAYGATLHVQGINPQGILFESTGSGATWSSWTSLDGILAATPTLAAPTSGLFMFDVNGPGLLWDQEDTTSWQGWNALSGVLEAGPVAVAAGANAFVFGLNSDGNLWYREWNGTSFGAWTNLGGILATA